MVQNKNTGTNSNAMSRALRFVVLEVSIRLRLIPIFTRWLKIAKSRSGRSVAVQNVSNALSQQMTYVLRTFRVKTKVGLAKSFGTKVRHAKVVFWQNAQIGESSN